MRPRARAYLALLSLALGIEACDPSMTLFVSSPPYASEKSMLISVSNDAGSMRVFAYAVDPVPAMLHLPIPSSLFNVSRLEVLLYDAPLTGLGIVPGELAVASEGVTRRVPKPDRVLIARIERGEALPWVPAPREASILASVRILGHEPCESRGTTFEAKPIVPEPGDEWRASPTFALPLDDREAFVALRNGFFYRVSPTNRRRLATISTTTPSLSVFRASDGDLYLFGPRGALARGHPGRGFEPLPRSASRRGRTWAWIDGAQGDAPFEIFAVTDDRTFERFDGRSWELILERSGPDIGFAGGVVWLGPEDAIATGLAPHAVVHYRGGELREEKVLDDRDPDLLTVLYRHPDLGVLVGTAEGAIYRREGSSWVLLTRAAETLKIRMITALDEGLLFGGSNGLLAEYQADLGACAPREYVSGHVRGIAQFGTSLLVVSNDTETGGAAAFLTRR